jgi:DNA-binding transcriptional regulator YiaG
MLSPIEQRFFRARIHLHRKKKTPRAHLSQADIYARKMKSKHERKAENSINKDVLELIRWVREIQERLQINNYKYAKLIGVTVQTIKLWKYPSGHLPSHKSFQKLLELERIAKFVRKTEGFRIKVRSN